MRKHWVWVFLWASWAAAQVVVQEEPPLGPPVVVVELPEGDVEHVAVLAPGGTALPETVCTWEQTPQGVAVATCFEGELPALLRALGELPGLGAVALLGPGRWRELKGGLEALQRVRSWALPETPCPTVTGLYEVKGGLEEQVRLSFPLFSPRDWRWELLPQLVSLLQRRLSLTLQGAQVRLEQQGGCWQLAVRWERANPHQAAKELKQKLQASLEKPFVPEELAALIPAWQRAAARWAVQGKELAVEAVWRAYYRRPVASLFYPPQGEPQALFQLAQGLLQGGYNLQVVERERRPPPPEKRTLANGAVLSLQLHPGNTAVVGLALGGVATSVGEGRLTAVALAAAHQGWPVWQGQFWGLPALALAVPGEELGEALELLGEKLAQERENREVPETAAAAGVGDEVRAENVSVALLVPQAQGEEGWEAAEKFLSSWPEAQLRSWPHLPGRVFRPGPSPAAVTLLVELPNDLVGWVGGEVLAQRWQGRGGEAQWERPPGRGVLLLTLREEGEAAAAEGKAEANFQWARRPVTGPELAKVVEGLRRKLLGQAGQAVARRAAAVFFPALAEVYWSPPELSEVNRLLAELPAWEAVRRWVTGPLPPDVPKSSSQGGGRP